MEYGGLEYGGVAGGQVGAGRGGGGAGGIGAPGSLEVGGGGCGAVAWAEVVWRSPALHAFDLPLLLLPRGLWGGGVAVVDGLGPVSAAGTVGFGVEVHRPPTTLPRALVLNFVEATVQR